MPQDTILQKTIIEELGMQNIPQDQQAELLTKMGDVLFKRILLETLEILSEEDQKIFGEMVDTKKSAEEVEEFLKSKIENYDEFVKKVADDFRKELTGMKDEELVKVGVEV
jgi:ABC-type Fe3+-hydroxamate transport system substrate-binding protein